MSLPIAIYGGGGFARELAWLVQSSYTKNNPFEVICFIDDDETHQGRKLNGIPVVSLEQAHRKFTDAKITIGIGTPHTREIVAGKAAKSGFEFATIIHPRVEKSSWVEVGNGTVICAGNILTTNIHLGQHVHINLDCTIGHDVIINDFSTLSPGVHVSGWVHIGKRVYLGTGAVIVNGTQDEPLIIGDDVVIGAAACVTKSVPPGLTVVGVPARPLPKKPSG